MSDWEILKEKGNEEFKKKNYQTAINLYSEAIELNQGEETLYANRATCFKALNKFKQAIYDFNNALKINPKSTKNLKRLSAVYILTGNLGEAEMLLQKCVNLEPKDSSHLTELNNCKNLNKDWESIQESKAKGDWKKCEELCEKLIKSSPEFTSLKLIYIEALQNNVKINESVDFILNKVSQEEKIQNEDFNFLLAQAFYYDGKYDKARKILAAIINTTKDNEKYNHLWKILKDIEKQKEKANEIFKSGKYDEAIEAYSKLLEIDPNNKNFNSTIYANRALCYVKKSQPMEALGDINKAINLNEKYTKAYLRRGNIYMSLKMYEEAKYDFQRVKDAEPSNEVNKLLEEAKREEKKAKKRDYHKILEIEKNADENQVRKAYKKLALKWHPDRNSTTEEQKKLAEKNFRDINDAYSVLSDQKKKSMYDQGIDPLNPEEAQGADGMHFGGGDGMHFGGDPSEIFKMFFGGGGAENIFNMGGMGGGSSGGFPFGNMGGMGGQGQGGQRRRPNQSGFTFKFQ